MRPDGDPQHQIEKMPEKVSKVVTFIPYRY
jgi:hypothetical protein